MFQFLSVLSVICLSLILSGCGRGNENGDGQKVLRFWHIMNYSGPQEVLEDAVKRFEQAHPGVRVEIDTFSNDDYKTKLALEMASGNEPDVFFNWGAGGQTGQYISQGRVLDMGPYIQKNGWESRFLKSAEELCRRDGKLYCAPLDLSVVVVWCNGRLFREHGLAYPKTWDDFQNVCQAFKSKGVTPLSLGNYDAWPGAFYFCYMANRLGGTALFKDAAANANGKSFGDEVFVKAGDMTRKLAESGIFNQDYAERKEDEARKLFVRGRSAMYLGGSWLVGQLVKDPSASDFLKDLEPIAFPALPGGAGDANVMLGGVNCGFSVSSSCKEPDLAMELIGYLTDSMTAEAWCKIGRIPACVVQDTWMTSFPEASKKSYKLLSTASGIQPYYDQYLSAEVTVEHKNTTRDLLKGRIDGKTAAKLMTDVSSNK